MIFKKITVARWELNAFGMTCLVVGIALGTYGILSGFIPHIFADSDITQTWDFSSAGDYSLSDANSVEITGANVRLKVKEYVADASTVGLYHLNETSGSTTADASAGGNNGSVTGSFVGSILNNGLQLNGSSGQVTIADNSSLSLAQSHSLEAWTKFDDTFAPGSHDQKQGIIDKGSYRLYYDQETAKVTYELQNSTAAANGWTKEVGDGANGSWDLGGKLAVSSQVAIGGNIYAGLGTGVGDAEVWKWDGSTWAKIGGDGINSSWNDKVYENVLSMAAIGNTLYAGLGSTAGDGEVWSCDTAAGCVAWTKIGGDAINGSWPVNRIEEVDSMTAMAGNLYVGTGASANDADVWKWDGSGWSKIGGISGLTPGYNSFPSGYESVSSMTNDGTSLYVGLGRTAGDGDVWKLSGTTWTQLGGDAIGSSWAASTIEQVLSIRYFNDHLYAGLGTNGNDGEVWMCTTTSNCTAWTKIGGGSVNSSWATGYEGVYSLTDDGTNVYAGLGVTAGDNEVWRWNGTAWTQIGGDGLNNGFTNTYTIAQSMMFSGGKLYAGLQASSTDAAVWVFDSGSWTQIGGGYINRSWGFYGLQNVESMTKSGDYLYAGTGFNIVGNALVWRYDGSTWQLVGGQGINNSWPANVYREVSSIISFGGNVYVGLGSAAGDGEVWKWDNSVWTKIGGDALNSSWPTSKIERINAMAVLGGNLYVGLGISNNDSQIWRWDGNGWLQVGGFGTPAPYNAFASGYENVASMGVYNGGLVVGMGSSAGDADVYVLNGTAWTKIGGDAVNNSWTTSTFEEVDSLLPYNGKLYAGLGTSAGDAEVWQWDGSGWQMVGGDNLNNSWDDGQFEHVRSLVVYNGHLMAGLGFGAGDAEVWQWDGDAAWTRIGGGSTPNSWGATTVERVESFSVYHGKLYAGLGYSTNADAQIWSYGNNGFLQSDAVGQDTSWHHIAATYDGATMKLYLDGTLEGQKSVLLSMPDSQLPLLIGSTFGTSEAGWSQGFFKGTIDEVRISNVARSSFTYTPYSTSAQTVQPTTAVHASGVLAWDSFTSNEAADGGSITYRLSIDQGAHWKYWDGSAWSDSTSLTEANPAATIDAHVSSLAATAGGFLWQAVLYGNGWQRPGITSAVLGASADVSPPTNPTILQATNQDGGGTALTSGNWYSYATPHFSWSGADDAGGSGVAGYFVYFGTDETADPETAGLWQTSSAYTAHDLQSGSVYHLRIKAADKAQNKASAVWAPFNYSFDATPPNNPGVVSASPSGYSNVNNYTFVWPATGGAAGTDAASGLAGYQYKTGAPSGALSDWSSTITDNSVTIADAAYQEGTNTFYLRTIDNAGNIQPIAVQTNFYFAGNAPTAPRNVSVNPASNTKNSFAFAWNLPESYTGSPSEMTYCYTVNTLPSPDTCAFTGRNVTSLAADAYATQPGTNTFYVVAKDETGNITYGAYGSVEFSSNTVAPGVPQNQDISDVSVKNTKSWKLALAWEAPESGSATVSQYQIYHSLDGLSYTKKASTTGIAFVDTGLTQDRHYYKIRACDNTNNCGAFTPAINMLPDGKFTEPAEIVAEPEAQSVTTKQATIKWSTKRTSDSKVAYGLAPGVYYQEEPSTPQQVTGHSVTLSNLAPGTTYYFKAKWTDEDGNTGASKESQFTTAPAPTVTDPTIKSIGLDSATIQFTVSGASLARISFGSTAAFGGLKELPTSTSESTYAAVLEGLQDGTKYYYRINPVDADGAEYPGSVLSFTTLPRPKLSNIRIQQVAGAAQPTIQISWESNTEVSSIATYYPTADPSASRDEVAVALVTGEHKLTIGGLTPQTPYTLIVKGTDKAGNQAVSDAQHITTSTDTRPPKITNVKIEGSKSAGDGKQAQLVVSWNTDEPATSQIELGDGAGSSYSQKTQEDANLTLNHLVVIPGLSPSKVYHLHVLSNDKAGNNATSTDMVTITPKATSDAFNLVLSNLVDIFGFLGALQPR